MTLVTKLVINVARFSCRVTVMFVCFMPTDTQPVRGGEAGSRFSNLAKVPDKKKEKKNDTAAAVYELYC